MGFAGKGLTLFAGAAMFLLLSWATDGLAQGIPVNFGVIFRNARLASLWIAEDEGFFKKQGVEVKVTNVSGGTQGAQMMVSGGVDVSLDDPTSLYCGNSGMVQVWTELNLERGTLNTLSRRYANSGCSKRSQKRGARKSMSGGVLTGYVGARRLSATKPMSLFQQPVKRATRRSSGSDSGIRAGSWARK